MTNPLSTLFKSLLLISISMDQKYKVLITLLVFSTFALLKCKEEGRFKSLPAKELKAYQEGCTEDTDCTYIVNGACDVCNGGKPASIMKSKEKEFEELFDRSLSCTEMGCTPNKYRVSCIAKICTLKVVGTLNSGLYDFLKPCTNNSDCVYAVNGHCDVCNGGIAVAITKSKEKEFKSLFSTKESCTEKSCTDGMDNYNITCMEQQCTIEDMRLAKPFNGRIEKTSYSPKTDEFLFELSFDACNEDHEFEMEIELVNDSNPIPYYSGILIHKKGFSQRCNNWIKKEVKLALKNHPADKYVVTFKDGAELGVEPPSKEDAKLE